jgi:hypothetical protein
MHVALAAVPVSLLWWKGFCGIIPTPTLFLDRDMGNFCFSTFVWENSRTRDYFTRSPHAGRGWYPIVVSNVFGIVESDQAVMIIRHHS